MAYATTAELAAYLGIDESDLPDDAGRLLERASEDVDYITLDRIDDDDTDHTDAAKKATMAQVEMWLETGEQQAIGGNVQGFQVGRLQVQYGAGSNRVAPIGMAPRARRFLLLAGLLYRGIPATGKTTGESEFDV